MLGIMSPLLGVSDQEAWPPSFYNTMGAYGLSAILATTLRAESLATSAYTNVPTTSNQEALLPLPLPDNDAWKRASQADPDLQLVIKALTSNQGLKRQKMVEKVYYKAYSDDWLSTSDGIVYHSDHGMLKHSAQLLTKVVPASLRRVVIAACHLAASPGHTGVYKTFHCVSCRFWWP